MERPLEEIPSEVFEIITDNLDARSLRALSEVSRETGKKVRVVSRTLRVQEEIDSEVLRLLPGVRRVEGVIHVRPINRLLPITRTIRGNLMIVQDDGMNVLHALQILETRAYLYPESTCSLALRIPEEGEFPDREEYRVFQYAPGPPAPLMTKG